jgi:UDP-N-acetyl-D-mannosaminuronic acid dehydrogenase
LKSENIDLNIYDPHVTEPEKSKYGLKNIEESVFASDIIIVGADHKEFKEINPANIAKKMRNAKIYDTKNIIDKEKWEDAGFEVTKIGDYSNYSWHKEYGIKEVDHAGQIVSANR